MKTLFVGNLCYTTGEKKIRDHFSQIGPVTAVRLITKKRYKGGFGQGLESKGYAFVEMEEADQAIEKLHNQELDGRRLLVKLAENPKPKRR